MRRPARSPAGSTLPPRQSDVSAGRRHAEQCRPRRPVGRPPGTRARVAGRRRLPQLAGMQMVRQQDPWRALLARHHPLVVPAAHDALSARLIERAGFPAYQIGGFALVGSRYGQPDIDLIHLGERRASVRDIMMACDLPVLVDLDDGYGDPKNVTFPVQCMEELGVSAVFVEDQKAPKKCGQMEDKEVVPSEVMEARIRAAAAARS